MISFAEKAQKVLEDAYMRRDVDGLREIYSAGVIRHITDQPDLMGIEELKEHVNSVRRAFSDCRVVLDKSFVSGDFVTWQWTFTGTSQRASRRWVFCDSEGETQIVKLIVSAGAKTSVKGCTVARVIDGRIVEEWLYYSCFIPSLNAAGIKLTQ